MWFRVALSSLSCPGLPWTHSDPLVSDSQGLGLHGMCHIFMSLISAEIYLGMQSFLYKETQRKNTKFLQEETPVWQLNLVQDRPSMPCQVSFSSFLGRNESWWQRSWLTVRLCPMGVREIYELKEPCMLWIRQGVGAKQRHSSGVHRQLLVKRSRDQKIKKSPENLGKVIVHLWTIWRSKEQSYLEVVVNLLHIKITK